MSTTTDTPDTTSTSDKWRGTSKNYSEQYAQFKLTSLYADDLITLLHDDLLQQQQQKQNNNATTTTTILDIGCGTGMFAHAYLRAFPNGIPGHTIISSDISPSMIELAQSTITSKLLATTTSTSKETMIHHHHDEQQEKDEKVDATNGCATKFLFQLEDGSQLSGILDHSIDIVVSLYGVFLIPDQIKTLQSIQRVLKPCTGIFANIAWTKHNDSIDTSFGGNVQETFMGLMEKSKQMKIEASDESITDTRGSASPEAANKVVQVPALPAAFMQWMDPIKIATNLTEQHNYCNVQTYRMFHSMIGRNFNTMFEMCIQNPMMCDAVQNLSHEQVETLKYTFFDLCQIPHSSIAEKENIIHQKDQNVPFTLWTASNITISHVV